MHLQQATKSGCPCRRLRCGHVFHLACVDKWSLGATDYSRPVSCALCNQPLVKQP